MYPLVPTMQIIICHAHSSMRWDLLYGFLCVTFVIQRPVTWLPCKTFNSKLNEKSSSYPCQTSSYLVCFQVFSPMLCFIKIFFLISSFIFILSLHFTLLNATASKSAMCMLVINLVSLCKVLMGPCLTATEWVAILRTVQWVHGMWTVRCLGSIPYHSGMWIVRLRAVPLS